MPRNINHLAVLEADALFSETLQSIHAQIADGPITDPEEFNLMMIALRNTVRAQQRVIKNFAVQLNVTP